MKKPVGVADLILTPGQVSFATRPTRLRTLLGSCVAVTFWHPQRQIGGMCHFMLPGRLRSHQSLDGRYADEALELLLHHAHINGTQAEDYQVKLFGGGRMFPQLKPLLPSRDVASLNIQAALTLVERHHLHLAAQDMGSTGYRTIMFDLWNGNVWVRHQPMGTLQQDA
ncbi:chemotaxis protein CheD [Pseudomonas sp. TKO26]|uniref:chemoreceptor glutamine deamidase CheD n=1 Tax=unclassified Pseudomonas TaxID=196821 RepID=UPI000D94ED76|nr:MULTISPECIES: chemoreceptor glutamine deamidase CheD [unclassified Pseudomonas]PYY83112.1 chemotaxis protein CheD [Pseudomonas sp. TKO30]PYY84658.1 chemotaxis protein CheD [Pseudomonas sp. TKO29]PYY86956.1 chemotaxis protein CheD [Pseudomonas sp. TKO26]PYY98323.1 chemotaxis protein CheD [Pseudomonas sp. TKO14]